MGLDTTHDTLPDARIATPFQRMQTIMRAFNDWLRYDSSPGLDSVCDLILMQFKEAILAERQDNDGILADMQKDSVAYKSGWEDGCEAMRKVIVADLIANNFSLSPGRASHVMAPKPPQ